MSFENNCVISKTLESFYNGIENIFKLYFETLGEKIQNTKSFFILEKAIKGLQLSSKVVNLLDGYKEIKTI